MGKVTASLDTAHYKGALQKVVTVRTNEPGAAPVMLELHAEITTLVDVTPSDTPVLQMIVGEPHPMELSVASSDGKPFDVLDVRADGPLDVAVSPPADAPRPKRSRRHAVAAGSGRYVVRVTPKADAPVGRLVAPVTLTTSIRGAETVPVQVTLMVNGRVRVMPTFLSVRPAPEPPVLHVKVTTAASGGLEILGVESSDPDFTATTTPVAAGREYDVTVRYGGAPGRGAVAGRITVRTNERGQETIVIPLVGST